MFIHELAQLTGVSAKTIRYYESIGLLPKPERAENNYRQYSEAIVERLRFIVSARSLGFNLSDVREFLEARYEGTLPCKRVLDSFDQRILEIDKRIADLLVLRETISRIRADGEALPPDKKCDEQCVCYLIEHEKEKI
ncbi:MAG: heavy metal-responsive transcriptional regulator [Anaerolineales bacterium]|nr:heavy metal-responsive transcriptional regulator [Anaerolineales bacterium]MBX3035786.1 heavy metal-responsive transcriptional regulator [Anaerolineales bacterium]